jgi:hypothetical protein
MVGLTVGKMDVAVSAGSSPPYSISLRGIDVNSMGIPMGFPATEFSAWVPRAAISSI